LLIVVFQKISFFPARDESGLMQGFLLHLFSSSIKSRFDPDFALFYFVLFSRKMVIQKTKKFSLIILKYLHNHNLYLLVKIK